MKEHDLVVLEKDISEYGLKKGDVGAIVHIYKKPNAFEVEFCSADGHTIALMTLNKDDLRNFESKEILHARAV